MVRQLLILAGLALGVSASANVRLAPTGKIDSPEAVSFKPVGMFPAVEAKLNDGSVAAPRKAAEVRPQWKRPAGQFWGTGYSIEKKVLGYVFTPLVLRPFTDYTFENISNVAGEPSWLVEYADFSLETPQYVNTTLHDTDLTWTYMLGEGPYAPILSYTGYQGYPSQYEGESLSEAGNLLTVIDKDIASGWALGGQPVCSKYWSTYTRNATPAPMAAFTGALDYDGNNTGRWFGTNAQGINASATRFEKPDQPYLLNAVYWYYQFAQDITKEVPLKAYVYKTVNPAADLSYVNDEGKTVVQEGVQLGDLIAYSEAVIPVSKYKAPTAVSDGNFQNAVKFEFVERNPVTGAETAVSLEIEDDITIVVVGFDAQLENGGYVTSAVSMDDYDEGYGNLGFAGTFEETEDGMVSYRLVSIPTFFTGSTPNTTTGILADVSYPWLITALTDQADDVHLPNDATTTETSQGLQYTLLMLASSPIEEWEISFNGEDSCDWFDIVDIYDQTYVTEDGEELYDGVSGLLFQADPNPEDVDRTCVVRLSMPAASYEITFRQGSNNTVPDGVEVVQTSGDAQYFDLEGRRVSNPDKGIYIKKSGNTATKVIL